MRSLLLCFMAPTKSLPEWQRITLARASEALWSKRLRRCRSYFISHFFGWRAGGINNRVIREFSILSSLGYASARERSPFFSCSKRGVRFLPYPPSWLAARRSWLSPASYFFTNRRHGSESLALRSPSSVCFCYANRIGFRSCQTQGLARNSAHRFNKRYDVRAIFWPFVLLLPSSRQWASLPQLR